MIRKEQEREKERLERIKGIICRPVEKMKPEREREGVYCLHRQLPSEAIF